MTGLERAYRSLTDSMERADWVLPTLARLIFAGVLLVYYLNSGMTKLGDGFIGIVMPAVGAYAQIFPKTLEAAGYDTEALSVFHHAVVMFATVAEFVLPMMIVLGFLTRIAALAMIGFVAVQSLTDLYGHGQWTELGAWFDRFPDATILDQRTLWVFLLLVLVFRGAGPISFDRALWPRDRR